MVHEQNSSAVFPDEDFPDRVLRSSLLLSLMIVLCSLSYVSLVSTLSIAAGCFISLAIYKTMWWTIRYGMRYRKAEIKKFFLKIGLLKYFIVGMALFSVCFFTNVNIPAMAFGLGVVLMVMVMKIGSRLLVDYLNKAVRVPSGNRKV
ncbi:MAG: hypothetical protein ACUBOA_06735 [Candidatus Loosdrechtia sp.]|uniref:hypothetical protein n=1 Tax=Candidatus Loosdrechtia sp. TaxID=3101272 RepID=UPI003A75E88E|nr:MAG: hypothetical protein QY305_10300 [Candidatus Jettenia sp. AMX2]